MSSDATERAEAALTKDDAALDMAREFFIRVFDLEERVPTVAVTFHSIIII